MIPMLSFLLGSCTQDDLFVEDPNVFNEDMSRVFSYKVPEDVATKQAKDFVAALEPGTRSVDRKVSEIRLLGSNVSTRGEENCDSLLYLINFENNEGFVLMSADTRSIPVYAISDKGNFIIDDSNKAQMTAIIEGAKQDVIAAANKNSTPSITIGGGGKGTPWPGYTSWASLPINFNIAPKLSEFQSRVSGYGEFAKYCRNSQGEPALSGCVGVATEQILSYYQHPTYIDGNFVSWETANSSNGTDVVARVLQLIGSGKYLDLYYRDMNNLALGNHWDVPIALTKLRYKHCGNYVNFFDNELQAVEELDKGPLLMYSWSTKYEGGHLWVIDGVIQYKVNTTEFTTVVGTPPNYVYPNLFHCVWGFPNGNCNGYYYADLYGFIGEACFKDAKDPISNEGSQCVHGDSDVAFLYGFSPIR